MEPMAEEVRGCLANTQFDGKPCTIMRGIGPQESFAFCGKENLVPFLGKNEHAAIQNYQKRLPEGALHCVGLG